MTRKQDGDRLTTAAVREATIALLDARCGDPAMADLLGFARLKKWTVADLAAHHDIGNDQARHRLRRLQQIGAVACLQGRIYGTGGREPDLYFLTNLGARALTGHLRLPPHGAIQAPTVALDAGEPTAGGLCKHKVAAKSAQDAHDLACLRLAIRLGWIRGANAAADGWRIRETLRYDAGDGEAGRVVPDFACWLEGGLWCVEVEGTIESAHIAGKHRRFAALARDLARRRGHDFRVWLTIVFSGDEIRKQVLGRHERAFTRQPWGYQFDWAILDDALASDPRQGLDPVCHAVDYQRIRERERARHERQADLYRG